MTKLNEIFDFLGLSARAEKIYKLLAERGQITASNLSQELNTPRSTIYLELENLRRLNLISITGSHGKRRFIMENPDILIEKIKEKTRETEDLLLTAQKIVQEQRKKIQEATWQIPRINFFKGIEGIKKILNLTNYAHRKEILGIIPIYDIYQSVGEKYLKKLTKERIKRGVRVKNIWPAGKIPEILQNHKEQLREVRFFREHLSLPSAILTFDNKVIIITSIKESLSIEIVSQDLAQVIKILFEMMWRQAAKKSSEI